MEPMKTGSRIGPYELVSPLGAGGMGEVWKARDTRLDRTVAIKFSHAAFSDRFQRESRAIAALNHPNIVTLHDVGDNYLASARRRQRASLTSPYGTLPKSLPLIIENADNGHTFRRNGVRKP